MKVLYTVSRLVRGGPSNQLYYLLTNLPPEVRTHLVTLSPTGGSSVIDRFEGAGVPMTHLQLGRVGGLVAARRRLADAVQEFCPDIVHTQGIRPDLLHAGSSPIPHVCTIRNYAWHDYPAKYGRPLGLFMALTHLRAQKKASRAVACSYAIRDLVAAHGVDAQVIHNGVDLERFHPAAPDEKREAKQRLGLPQGQHIFLSLGSLIPRKDPATLLAAFQAAFPVDQAVLLLVGGGSEMEACRRAVGARRDIRLVGDVSIVDDYLRAADTLVSASTSEGLPNAVLEAAAAGLDLVLSDIPQHREVTGPTSDAVLWFPSGNRQALAGVLREASGGRSREAGPLRAVVVDRFSAAAMADRYAQLYEGLCRTGVHG